MMAFFIGTVPPLVSEVPATITTQGGGAKGGLNPRLFSTLASTWDLLRSALKDGFQNIDRRLQEYGPLEPERFRLQEANQRLAKHLERTRFRVEVICLHDDGEQRCSVMEMERDELAMETLGLSVAEGKAMLRGVQDFVVSQQSCMKRRFTSIHENELG